MSGEPRCRSSPRDEGAEFAVNWSDAEKSRKVSALPSLEVAELRVGGLGVAYLEVEVPVLN